MIRVISNQTPSKFHIWIASINLSFKFEYGFCLTSNNQDGRQNGRHVSISAVVVTLTQSFLIGFLLRATLTFVGGALLFSACPSVCLSVHSSVCGHSNSVILNWISSKFHIWIAFINLLFKFEYGFCLTSDNQDG